MKDEEAKTDILRATIGDFGRWQCRVFILMALLKIPIAWFQLGIIFMAPPTDFWCRQPEDFKHLSTDQWRSHIDTSIVNSTHDACRMMNIEYEDAFRNTTTKCKWGFEYDKKIVDSSIISEWNLVCGNEYMVDIVQVSFMCGVLLGGIIFGVLSDRFGRKKILITCITIQALFGVISAWMPLYIWFLAIRFVLAVANGGTLVTSFVMCIEVVNGRWKTIIPILYQIPFGIGNTIMAAMAYYIRDWRYLQLALSFGSLIFVSYHWFLSESPRWLIATNNKERAIHVLEKGVRYNRGPTKDVRKIVGRYFSNGEGKTKFTSAFRNRKLRMATVLLSIQWFLLGIIFYAFTQYLGRIGGNIFMNVALGGLMTIPGAIICIFVVNSIGRKWTIGLAHLLMASTFIILLVLPSDILSNDWPKLILAGFDIIALSMSTSALYLYTGELYPTIVRNAAVGGCVMFFKVGAILAPLVLSTQDYAHYLPLTILCVMAIIETLILYPLPDSNRSPLPDNKHIEMTVISNEDAEDNEHFISRGDHNDNTH